MIGVANRAAFDERLPEDKLRQLYVEERVGAQAIAQQVGCSVRMVYLRLAELKVPLHHPDRRALRESSASLRWPIATGYAMTKAIPWPRCSACQTAGPDRAVVPGS